MRPGVVDHVRRSRQPLLPGGLGGDPGPASSSTSRARTPSGSPASRRVRRPRRPRRRSRPDRSRPAAGCRARRRRPVRPRTRSRRPGRGSAGAGCPRGGGARRRPEDQPAQAGRSRVPSSASTSSPKASTTAARPGVPGSTTSRASRSASTTTAPRSVRTFATVLLPDATPPVSPTRMAARYPSPPSGPGPRPPRSRAPVRSSSSTTRSAASSGPEDPEVRASQECCRAARHRDQHLGEVHADRAGVADRSVEGQGAAREVAAVVADRPGAAPRTGMPAST